MKKIIITCLGMVLLLSISFASNIDIVFNGEKLVCDVAPVEIENRILVPVRAILEKAGATVDFNFDTNVVTIVKENIVVKLRIGSKMAYVNEVEKVLDVPATEINDRTMIPIRFVGENLGLNIAWEQISETSEVVKITTNNYVVQEKEDIVNDITKQQQEIQNKAKLKADIRNANAIGQAVRVWLTDGTEKEIKERKESIRNKYVNYSALKDIDLYISTAYRTNLGKEMSLRYYAGLAEDGKEEKVVILISNSGNKVNSIYSLKNEKLNLGVAYIEGVETLSTKAIPKVLK